MFSNIKIGTRLIAGFILVATISSVVGIVGISNASKINVLADHMYEQDLLGLSHIKEANINLIYIGRARSNFLLATSQEERQQHLASIKKASIALESYMEKAKPLFVGAKAQEIFASYAKLSVEYEKDMQNALNLATDEKLQEHSEALTKALATVREKGNQIDDTLTSLTKLKEERAREAANETTAIYENGRSIMMAAIAFSVLLGIALGFIISRSVTVPLIKAKDAASRLAEGDLTVKIESTAKD